MLQEIMGYASITTTHDLHPGEMDRYAGRLNEVAGMLAWRGRNATRDSARELSAGGISRSELVGPKKKHAQLQLVLELQRRLAAMP